MPHVVYLSSLSVYADPASRRLDESAVPDATDVYGLTKRLGEEVCRAAVARDGLQIFTISADELAGRWSTAKARDLLAWHPRFTPPPVL